MSVHESRIRYIVGIEGADEAIEDISDVLSTTSRTIGLVTSLDYAFMSFQRTTEDFNILNFARTILSTISLIQNLIAVTKAAEMAQWAYNKALAVGQALTPWGWLFLGVAAGTALAMSAQPTAGGGPEAAMTPQPRGIAPLGKYARDTYEAESNEEKRLRYRMEHPR